MPVKSRATRAHGEAATAIVRQSPTTQDVVQSQAAKNRWVERNLRTAKPLTTLNAKSERPKRRVPTRPRTFRHSQAMSRHSQAIPPTATGRCRLSVAGLHRFEAFPRQRIGSVKSLLDEQVLFRQLLKRSSVFL